MIVVVSANSGIDVTYELSQFRINGVNRAQGQRSMIGGKAVNVLRTLARLGVPAQLLTFGDKVNRPFFEAELAGLNCPYRIIPTGNPLRVCSIIVDTATGASTVVNGPGPFIDETERTLFLDCFLHAVREDDSKYFVLAGSLPEGMPEGTYEELIGLVRKYRKYVLVDAAGPVLQQAVRAAPNLVKVNAEEFSVLVGAGQSVVSTVDKYLKAIDNIVITRGSEGADCYTPQKRYAVQPLDVGVPVNPTGCGDAFLGGYVAGLARGYPVTDCLKLANAAAYANLVTLWPDIADSLDKIGYFTQNTVINEQPAPFPGKVRKEESCT